MNKQILIDLIKAPLPGRRKIVRTQWRFWPSEASCVTPNGDVIGQCLRRSYYQWTGVDITNPPDDFVKNLGKIGCFLEEKTREEFKRKGIYDDEANTKVNRHFTADIAKDLILSGEIDIVVAGEKENCGVEVKNYSNSTYKIENRPKDPHLLQAFLYVVYYRPQQPYFVLYYRPSMISKYAISDVYHRIDFIEVNKEIYPVINGDIDKNISINRIISRYKETKYHIENQILPKRDFMKSSKSCQYCPYKMHCWKGSKGTTYD